MAAGEQVEFVLPFLFSVIRNKALHYLRRESLKYQIHGSVGSDASREIQFRINTLEACDPHALYAEDVQTILHKSLDALGRQTRRVFMLSRFEGMSNRQIAQELGISEKSVEYHVTKALKNAASINLSIMECILISLKYSGIKSMSAPPSDNTVFVYQVYYMLTLIANITTFPYIQNAAE